MGTLLLIFAAPLLAKFAIGFSSVEYFWLALLGLSCAAIIATGSPLKGAVSLLFGLFVSTIGIDVIAGQTRFTMGSMELMGGVSFIPAMIGMFAFSEIIRTVTSARPPVRPPERIGSVFGGLGANLWRRKANVVRGGLSGSLIGALPGAGADIAAWVSYSLAKRFSKQPEKFGKGHDEGLIEAGASNNGALSGAWVPTMVFGIPGDSITAIVIGVLYLKGREPGPIILLKPPDLGSAVFIAFLLANLLLIPLGWMIIRLSRYVLRIPPAVFLPIVLLCCMVGSYAINNTLFGVGIMLVFGLVGWLFEENGIPVAPAILGLVLGGMVEFNFVTSLLKSDGDLLILFSRPIAAVLGVVTILVWLTPVVLRLRKESNMRSSESAPKPRRF